MDGTCCWVHSMVFPIDPNGWDLLLGSRGGFPHRSPRMGPGVGFTAWFSPQIPVDGSWGPWAPWSSCSRSCGGGVTSSHRFCSRPTPRNGGRFCRGERLRFRSCNVGECPGSSGECGRAVGPSRGAMGHGQLLTNPTHRSVPGGAVRCLQPPRRLGGSAGGGRLGAAVRRRRRRGPM